MNWLRLIAFWLVFAGGTVIAVFGSIPAAIAGGRPMQRYTLGWARFHAWCVRHLLGIRVRVEGTVPTAPVLIASKHQAMLETFDLLRICGPVAVLAKEELLRIPLWGRVAKRYGVIPVDRAGSATALRAMLRGAQAEASAGRSIVIFPEGTRVAPGEQPPLRAGFAGLYRGLGLPVVPVALDSGRLWPRNRATKTPGTVTIRFMEAVPPGLPRAEADARVHAAINALEAARPPAC